MVEQGDVLKGLFTHKRPFSLIHIKCSLIRSNGNICIWPFQCVLVRSRCLTMHACKEKAWSRPWWPPFMECVEYETEREGVCVCVRQRGRKMGRAGDRDSLEDSAGQPRVICVAIALHKNNLCLSSSPTHAPSLSFYGCLFDSLTHSLSLFLALCQSISHPQKPCWHLWTADHPAFILRSTNCHPHLPIVPLWTHHQLMNFFYPSLTGRSSLSLLPRSTSVSKFSSSPPL